MNIPPISTNSLIHFSLKVWENVIFELGSERVDARGKSQPWSITSRVLFHLMATRPSILVDGFSSLSFWLRSGCPSRASWCSCQCTLSRPRSISILWGPYTASFSCLHRSRPTSCSSDADTYREASSMLSVSNVGVPCDWLTQKTISRKRHHTMMGALRCIDTGVLCRAGWRSEWAGTRKIGLRFRPSLYFLSFFRPRPSSPVRLSLCHFPKSCLFRFGR